LFDSDNKSYLTQVSVQHSMVDCVSPFTAPLLPERTCSYPEMFSFGGSSLSWNKCRKKKIG